MKTKLLIWLGLMVLVSIGPQGTAGSSDPETRVVKGSEFTFVRVQFNSFTRGGGGRGRGGRRGGRTPGWAHDYPRADSNLLNILAEVTNIQTTAESYLVVNLLNPLIMEYPFLYFSEPGTWDITDEEAANFREYLNRGGFAVFDDFGGQRDWQVFTACMRKVFPDLSIEKLNIADPIFHCYFDIETLDIIPPYNVRGTPEFLAMRDDTGRMQAVINFNNDIGDYWEWSDQSLYPINLSNEAYKLGVNYVVYSMTH